MNYEAQSPAELWSCALSGCNTDRELYFVLSELVLRYNQHQSSTFFPPKSGPLLLDLLEKPHDPQLKIVVCTLIGYLCNVTSTAKENLTNRGVIDLLLRIIEFGLPEEKKNSAESRLTKLLFEHVTSMLQYFSLGPTMCLRKMSVADAVRVISQLIDKDNPTMFWYGSSETLENLALGRLLVAERFDMTSAAASTVFYQQLGYDFKSRFCISGSYVLDLFDTNGDDDVHIVEELDKRCSVMLYGSREQECEIENVNRFSVMDVRVMYCINDAYFWAVLGHEDIDQLSAFESQLSNKDEFPSLDRPPVIGQMVGAQRGDSHHLYRAQVLSVKKGLETRVSVFAIDYGFTADVLLSELKSIGKESRFQLPGVAHLCKLMGVRRKPVCENITFNLLHTLCNLTADLSPGMAERILATNLLESLNHLSTYSDVAISSVVIQILSNMSCNELLKTQLAQSGVIDSVIGIVKWNMPKLSTPQLPNPDVDQLIESCIVMFWNFMYNCGKNKDVLVQKGGIHLVTELVGLDKPESVRQTALKTLRVFVGKVAMTSSMNHRRPREDILDDSGIGCNPSDSDVGSDSSDDTKLMSLHVKASNGDSVNGEVCNLLRHTTVDSVNEYVLDQSTFLRNSANCELIFGSFEAAPEKKIARLICAFLNRSSDGGSIYFGLKKGGIVEGQVVPHSSRDHLRLCIDKLTIKKLSPSAVPGVVSTMFHTVLDSANGVHITDRFVIEIRVKPSLTSTLYGVKYNSEPKAFVRVGSRTIEMTAKDLYVWSVEMSEALQLKELQQLQHEVDQLKKIRAKIKGR